MAEVLEEYGFVSPAGGLAASADEAARLAAGLGFPVALKIASPDILHKTDVGGVVLGCDCEDSVRTAFSRILANVGEKAPHARVDGVRVEEMCGEGTEVILGLHEDRQFGPVIMFGLGGIFTEVLHDVSFRVLPITRDDARSMIREIRGRPILEGYRGRPPVAMDTLVDLLMRAGSMGMDLAGRLESVDFNPIVVRGDRHWVLDAKIILRDRGAPVQEIRPDTSHLRTFFEAKSVALIGASATPGKISNYLLDSLARHEYKGTVYPVNPGRAEIMGLKAYPSLASIPGPVDLVVVIVGLSTVPDIVRECVAKGVHNMILISGGGKELSTEGERLELAIRDLVKAHGIRTLGPNCTGVFDGETRIDTFFIPRMARPARGSIAMTSQSGTMGIAFMEASRHVGLSKFISYGNRVDVDEADLVTYLADDPGTRVIACYVEGFGDGRKFLFAAREASKKKPIVVYKAGRSMHGARASISHTGFFGGTYAVCRGAFKQAGIIGVDSFEEFHAVAGALALQPRARGARVGMISHGAGPMVQALDLLEEYGLELPPLAPPTVARLREGFPPYYFVQNPMDLTGSSTAADFDLGIRALLEDPGVDMVMAWFAFQGLPMGDDIVGLLRQLGEEARRHGKPLVCGATGGEYANQVCVAVEEVGVPVGRSVREWVAAARGLAPLERR